MRYFRNIGTALSQFTNTVVLFGDCDETISGRSYRQGYLENHKAWKISKRVVDIIFFWELDHCKVSYYRDVENAKMIIERNNNYRNIK